MAHKNVDQPIFLWGAATSSHQIEGYNDKNDWAQWENKGRTKNGIRSGAATDHLNRFREDIRLAAELGLNSYRFSIEWSRLEPEEDQWDSVALNWYLQLIHECEQVGLIPMLTLHHFTSPKWFADKGGFTWEKSPERFAKLVKYIARNLGPSIPLWCTFNEPMVLILGTYIGTLMPPGDFSPKKASLAFYHILQAHVFAYDILHSEISQRRGPWAHHPIQVCIAHNMLDFIPQRIWHPIDHLLCILLRRFYNQAWLDAITGRKQNFGMFGIIPSPPCVKKALGRHTIDFIGVNYYTNVYIEWSREKNAENTLEKNIPFKINFSKNKKTISDLGWEIHPTGLTNILKLVSRYNLPIMITENGIADQSDKLRSDFLLCHLKEIALAIKQGIDIRGYYYWSLLDNFEWNDGFEPRFGLYKVDYATFSRTTTASALLYKEIIVYHLQKKCLPKLDYFLKKIELRE